jgi:hypothetical protein
MTEPIQIPTSSDELLVRFIEQSETIEQLRAQNQELTEKVEWFTEQYLLARKKQFGSSSERTDPSLFEMIFNEPEVTLDSDPEPEPEPTPEKETITYQRAKSSGRRQEAAPDVEIETRKYHLPEDKQICSCCGGKMHEMSTSTRCELKWIPAQQKMIHHVTFR